MKKLLLLTGLTSILAGASAQDRIETGLTALPSVTTFHTGSSKSNYEPIFAFNYGGKVKWRRHDYVFSTGILHLTQGTKLKVEETSSENPEGTGEFFDLYMKTYTIAAPLSVDYIFASTGSQEFFVGIGAYVGYMYLEQLEDTSVPKDYEPDPFLNEKPAMQRLMEFDAFEDFYAAANFGIGMRQSLSDRLSLQVRPNFLFQLREELPSNTNRWTNRLMSWNCDVGVYYQF